jgi:hypothetical protein
MIDVETAVVVHRPQGVVAAYAANPDNAPEWYRNIDSAERQTSGTLPSAPGSRSRRDSSDAPCPQASHVSPRPF